MKSYYSRKELLKTPSIEAGMSPDEESKHRVEGVRLIIEIGLSMGLSPQTVATGAVYFHRFYILHKFQDFPRFQTACACLFLAGKVEETPKKCKDIIKAAESVLDEEKFKLEFNCERAEQKSVYEEIMALERVLLLGIKFNLQVEHPYTFLIQYAKGFKGDKPKLEKLVQMAWTFVNDSLCTTLCLQWEPEIIAIALIFLAGKLCRMEIQDWEGRRSGQKMWWEMHVFDMSDEILEDICHQVLDLYSPIKQSADSGPNDSTSNPQKKGTKRTYTEAMDCGNIPLPPGPSPRPSHQSQAFSSHLPSSAGVLPPVPSHFVPPHQLGFHSHSHNQYLMHAAQNMLSFIPLPGATHQQQHSSSNLPNLHPPPPPPIIRP